MTANELIQGDNLEILKTFEDETVDLIYLDPPFFSNRNYEVIWGDEGEVRSFGDRWEGGIDHYIAWLRERVEQMYRVLKPTGSMFLHCDWHADAYIRVGILDRIFGMDNFRNAIVWCYRQGGRSGNNFGQKHDTIYWYTKSKERWTFNADPVRVPYEGTGGYQTSGKGVTIKGKRYKPNDLGKIPEDWWDIPALPPMSGERIGYPTQKPEALLKRIIECASNKGDIVLDPFVGGGTTVAVADKLNRRWIGIDQSAQAVEVTRQRIGALKPDHSSLSTSAQSAAKTSG